MGMVYGSAFIVNDGAVREKSARLRRRPLQKRAKALYQVMRSANWNWRAS